MDINLDLPSNGFRKYTVDNKQMQNLIRDGHNGKSAGPDGITNELEKDLLRIP